MRLVVLTNEQLKEELLSTGISDDCKVDWINSSKHFSSYADADAVIDLLFEQNGYDTSYLNDFVSRPVFVNSMNKTITEINLPVIRINAWPGFLKRSVAEACCNDEVNKNDAEQILSFFEQESRMGSGYKRFYFCKNREHDN